MRKAVILTFGLACACSDDPKPAEPVEASAAGTEATSLDPSVEASTIEPEPSAAEPEKVVVQPEPTISANPLTAPAGETFKNPHWVFVDDANVRAQPSTTAAKVGTLAWGTKVDALSVSNGWVKIGEGKYVNRRMLTDRKKRFGKDKAAH